MTDKTGTRRFEYVGDKSSKFWEIRVIGASFTVCYGKIGTDGQTQTKEFADVGSAEKQAKKLIAEKTVKGYREVDSAQSPVTISASTENKNEVASLIDPALNYEQKLDLAYSRDTASDILEALANDEEQGINGNYGETFELRSVVASNPKISINLLLKLLADDEFDVRVAAVKNPLIPQDLLYQLSEDGDLVNAVAQNSNCPSPLLEKLSKAKDDELRCNIAANPNCPITLLKKWAKLKDESIRGAVAINPSTPVEILELLASDKDVSVRAGLAGNPACPLALLVRLSEDAESNVRRYVAVSDQCPAEILARLENDPDTDVISQVASNCQTPQTILARLAVHDVGKVRVAVAQNPAAPPDLQKIALTIPTCYFPENDGLAEVMEPVRELKKLVEQAKSEFPEHSFLSHHGLKDIEFCSPAWGLKIFDIPTQHADRTRSMLEGPFFTSDEYPWPSGDEGKCASPVVQLDLREVTRLKGNDYGDGLLQVFVADDSSNFEIRVIPRSDVNENQMTPIPQGTEDQFSGFKTAKYWLGYGGFVSQIVGYEEPVLSAHVYASDGAPEDDDPDLFKEIFEKMESLSINDSGMHMFGTFYPIQYCHSEYGGEVLMALDSDLCYSWGDCGNAQIFVNRSQDGAVRFHIEWSCY
jgi:predicted DNA-binding WGR domain protein